VKINNLKKSKQTTLKTSAPWDCQKKIFIFQLILKSMVLEN